MEVKDECHRIIASVAIWSMRHCLKGKFPSVGAFGEKLLGSRGDRAGEILCGGHHCAYYGFKAECKARKETHKFDRTYGHNQICEGCLAERPNKNGDPSLVFKNFYEGAAHTLTHFTRIEYLRTSEFESPWEDMPGFDVRNCFRDPMHIIFLGTAKDLLASCLGYWCRNGYIEGPNIQQQLRLVSVKQKQYCKAAGLRATFKTYTPSNTGLLKRNEYPELGSSFKAATIKSSICFFAKFASEIAASNAEVWIKKFKPYVFPSYH